MHLHEYSHEYPMKMICCHFMSVMLAILDTPKAKGVVNSNTLLYTLLIFGGSLDHIGSQICLHWQPSISLFQKDRGPSFHLIEKKTLP